jgi:tripartite-type tricarboxylate transporter receptor subunit TctC
MRGLLALAAWISAVFLVDGAQAQSVYPVRVVKIVVGFPAGNSVDILTRVYAQKLSEKFGQQFIVESRPGASGNVAAESVARAEADGYTLFIATVSNTIGASLLQNLKFDFSEDFAAITLFASTPNILVVSSSLGVSTLQDLIRLAKSRPGELSYASPGIGSGPHMAGELFNQMTGANLVHVPYRGTPPAIVDLLGGRLPAVFATVPTAAPYVKDGRVIGVAVSTARRSALVPEVPTMAESGLVGFDTGIWYGVVAPKGTPQPVLRALAEAFAEITEMVDVKIQLANNGAEPQRLALEAFGSFIKDEIKKWRQVIKIGKIAPQ